MNEISVFFYVLEQDDLISRLRFACKLAQKATESRQLLVFWCEDEEMKNQLDNLLWSFSAADFIPHCDQNHLDKNHCLIWLASYPELVEKADLLVNLTNSKDIDFPNGCRKIYEIVSQETKTLEITRARYLRYKNSGFLLDTHKIDK